MDKEIACIRKQEIIDACIDEYPQQIIEKLWRACGKEGYGKANTAEQLRLFKKYTPRLIDLYLLASDFTQAAAKQVRRYEGEISKRHNKRWTDDEDNTLIELVCNGDSMTEVATCMGRTPGAIAARVSHLVGISRLTQQVAGVFFGTLDGEYITGKIDGAVSKVVA